MRSAARDLGPAKQAQPLPLESMAKFTPLAIDDEKGTPLSPGRACLLASWWLLREIEASHVKLSHVKLDESGQEASLMLPNSKTGSHTSWCSSSAPLQLPKHRFCHMSVPQYA